MPSNGLMTSEQTRKELMTVGELARRTGVSIKNLRQYTDWGLINTVGRSATNYRLYTAEALWCVHFIGQLRSLGLTVAEIRELTVTDAPIGPRLVDLLHRSRARLTARIAELQQSLRHMDHFEATHRTELASPDNACWVTDSRCTDCA